MTADLACLDEIEDRWEQVNRKALAILIPGTVFRIFRKPNPNHRVCHVRAVVDNEYIVYRVWRPGKGWGYRLESAIFFGLLIEDNSLIVIRKEPL